ncbi:MAG: tRNA pseudouridine(38-40) synthase TruA [candidate division WOR-3 bacterium]|nr:tRNA pseudouridine(38-40) synthase TruA [candidate division WOR-3 bacterium]
MNVLIEIEYDGTEYAGWQYQPHRRTIQGEIEKALYKILRKKIRIIGAGRTDAGVSALGQIANFHLDENWFSQKDNKSLLNLQKGLNAILPDDIFIKSIRIVADNFNARYSAKSKIYQYRLITTNSPLRKRFAWFIPYELDLNKMKYAANLFLHQFNFSKFCHLKNKDAIVRIKSLKIMMSSNPIFKNQRQDEIIIRIEADRFLYKMVRRIVGALVDFARGKINECDILNSFCGEKHRPIVCAPANGLLLLKVKY